MALDAMSMVLGGLMGGGKSGGSSSSSSSNASNVLNLAFNPSVFSAIGDGPFSPSTSGSPSGSASGSPSSDAGRSSPSSGMSYPFYSTTPRTSADGVLPSSAVSGGNNSMILMLMLGVGALYMVSRS